MSVISVLMGKCPVWSWGANPPAAGELGVFHPWREKPSQGEPGGGLKGGSGGPLPLPLPPGLGGEGCPVWGPGRLTPALLA